MGNISTILCGEQTYASYDLSSAEVVGLYQLLEGIFAMKLDVGCGNNFSGDINTDLIIKDTLKHRGVYGKRIATKKIKNFVLCDGQYLPFKNNCFDEVYSSHVIEHVKNPYLFMDELLRVSNNKIEVRCPFRFSEKLLFGRYRCKGHIHFFNKTWFIHYIKKNKLWGSVEYTKYMSLLLFFNIPCEVRALIRKGESSF